MTDAAIARELSAWHVATRQAVSASLDVEAGLREVLLASEHDAVRADLAAELQVESGLAAILHRDVRTHPQEPGSASSFPQGEGPVAQFVLTIPDAQRLRLRSHPSVRSFDLAELRIDTRELAAGLGNLVVLDYLRDVERVLTRARGRAWRGGSDHGADLIQALRSAHALTDALAVLLQHARNIATRLPAGQERASAQEIARAIDAARERTVKFVRDLTHARDAVDEVNSLPVREELFETLLNQARSCDPVEARSLAQALDQHLNTAIDQVLSEQTEGGDREVSLSSAVPSRELTAALQRTPATERADALVWLRDILDDFQGADLHDADLTGVPLEGLRWSDSTQWPDDWKETIKQRSDPSPGAEGIFVVRGNAAGEFPEKRSGLMGKKNRSTSPFQ